MSILSQEAAGQEGAGPQLVRGSPETPPPRRWRQSRHREAGSLGECGKHADSEGKPRTQPLRKRVETVVNKPSWHAPLGEKAALLSERL